MGHKVPWSLLRDYLRKGDNVERIRKRALGEFERVVVEYIQDIAQKAAVLMNHDERNTILKKDIDTAVNMVKNDI